MSKQYYRDSSKVETVNPTTPGGKIVVLYGGMSAEREISVISSKRVIASLVEQGYRVTTIDVGADFISHIQQIKPDIIFNCLHGTYGEDGCVPGALNMLRIPYTHSGVLASAIAFDKEMSQKVLEPQGVKMANRKVIELDNNKQEEPLARPYIIKPLRQGSSIGTKLVAPNEEFDFDDYAKQFGNKVLVEEYIKGRELQVAVLKGKALGLMEIKPLKREFYDYDSKYTEGFTTHILSPDLPEGLEQQLLTESERIYKLLNCRGTARVEYIYKQEQDELYFLEINTHPGITPMSLVPEIADNVGIKFDKFIKTLLEDAYFEQ